MRFTKLTSLRLLLLIPFLYFSCGKGGSNPPQDPCNGVTISVTGTATNASTFTANDGSITVNASGGAGFTYSLNGGTFQSSATFNGLAPGSYSVTAKSSAGCSGNTSITVGTAPNPCTGITINVTGSSVNPTTSTSNNGSIATSATGSSGFTYSLNGGAFQSSGTFNNLGAGAYTITAKDLNGCTGSASFTLTAPNPCTGVTITVTGTSTNPTSGTANNGSITASATGSTGFTYSLNSGAFQASGAFNNLGAGSYTVTAKDANGCTGSANFTLTAPNPCAGVTIGVSNATTNNIPCQTNTASITVTANGGATPYTYSRDGVNFQTSNIFSPLASGTYTITAKDNNGCMGTAGATVGNAAAGTLFNQVKAVLQANCNGCHNSASASGGMNWEVDCNIVQFKDRIRARAVDGNPSPMPTGGLMPQNERDKITAWINAGGRYSD